MTEKERMALDIIKIAAEKKTTLLALACLLGGYFESEGNKADVARIVEKYKHYSAETIIKTRQMMERAITKTPEFNSEMSRDGLAFLDRYFLGRAVKV